MHITKGKADWIDFLNPSEEDLKWLKSKFGLHDLILEELKGPSARPKAEGYDNYIYLVYYFPVFDQKEQTSRKTEIDFIITRHQVITVHYEKIEPFVDVETAEANNSLELLHLIISSLLDFEMRQLHHIQEKIEYIGGRLFKNHEREVLEKISRMKRDISEYRIITKHQEPILDSLLIRGGEFWGPGARIHLNDLIGENLKIINHIESFRETINDFEDTNNQIMNLKINSVMKTFTILSFLTFPFVLFATVFGIHLDGNPLLEMENAFWVLLSIMVVGLTTLAIYFVKRKWL